MVRCPQCSCPSAERRQRCVVCGNELRMIPLRVDGRRTPTTSPGPSAQPHAQHGIWERLCSAAHSRISIAELGLLVVLAALVASLSVAVVS